MHTRNPKIDGGFKSVQHLLREMKKDDPQVYRVVGNIPVPDWRGIRNHFQGIAPINGETRITGDISASADEAWFATFREGTSPPAVVEGVWETRYYDHAGGVQRIGELLALPLENNTGGSTVAFFKGTQILYELDLIDGHKASGVAVTNYTEIPNTGEPKEHALLLVYRYEPKTFDIYRAPADDIGTDNWEFWTESSPLPDDTQYQCFGLVTQIHSGGILNEVFLLAFSQDEDAVLLQLDVQPDSMLFGTLTEVERFKFHGSQWRYGVGLQIASDRKIRIFGCSEDPSGDFDDYEFPIYFWG